MTAKARTTLIARIAPRRARVQPRSLQRCRPIDVGHGMNDPEVD